MTERRNRSSQQWERLFCHSRWRLQEDRIMAKATTRASRPTKTRKWSADVTEHSHALALESKVFAGSSPKRIAASLKRSAESSTQRKADPYRSAMSMLSFYINRAGKNLPAARKKTLEHAKDALRKEFGRD
jgi:hypothetical protein